MPTGTLVAVSTLPQTNNDVRDVFVASNGHLVALLGGPHTPSTWAYATSSDGVTWSAPVTLTAPSSFALQLATAWLSDVLWSLTVDTADTTLTLQSRAYNTGTNTLGAATTANYQTGTPYQLTEDGGAAWDSVQSVWHVLAGYPPQVTLWALTNAGARSGSTAISSSGSGSALTGRAIRLVPGTPTAGYVLLIDAGGSLTVTPFSYNGGAYSVGTTEVVATGAAGSFLFAAAELDASNNLDVVWVDSGGNLATRKRTGVATYGAVIPLASHVNTAAPQISTSRDASGGVWVLWSSIANRSTGEIYGIQRSSGIWKSPVLVAGGDASGYINPKTISVPTTGTRVDTTYQVGGVDVYYLPVSYGSQPDTPVGLAPSGFVGTLTPTLSYTDSNHTAPADGQGAVEYQVKDGATVIWNSGFIATSATSNVYGTNSVPADPDYVAPVSLVYGHSYPWQARTKDTILGLASAFSTALTFTPVQAGVVAITSVTDNGVTVTTPPDTIASPTFDGAVASWTDSDGHAAASGFLQITETDGTTIVATGPVETFSPALATGGSHTFASWATTTLVNSHDYLLWAFMTDATTGLVSQSASFALHTTWTPPPPVTGLVVTSNLAAGTVTGSWTNPTQAVTDLVAWSEDGGTTWTTLKSGSLFTGFTDRPRMNTALLYRVTDINALGIASTPVTASAVTLGANGDFGVSLVDALHTDIFVWLGILDQGDWKSASGLQQPTEESSYVPLGGEIPIRMRRRTRYALYPQRAYSLAPTAQDATGATLDSEGTVATLKAMAAVDDPLLYRDIRGRMFWAAISSVEDAVSPAGWPLYRVQFDLFEIRGLGRGVPLAL